MALIESPEYVAAFAREDEELDWREAEYVAAEAPLVAELRAAGLQVESAWDLVNTRASYPEAVPILLAHLPRPYPAAVREGIARALAVPDATYAWSTLVRQYRGERDKRVKDGLAVAVAGATNSESMGALISLVRDTSLGPSRLLLLWPLERSTDPQARRALMDLGTDPDLTLEIQDILKRQAKKQARRAKRAAEREATKPAKANKPAKATKATKGATTTKRAKPKPTKR